MNLPLHLRCTATVVQLVEVNEPPASVKGKGRSQASTETTHAHADRRTFHD